MAVDLSVFGRQKSITDQQQLQQAFEQQKAFQNAQIGALTQKANYLDIDKLGEQAFFKAAQGLQLSPQEAAAAKVVDAKSGGIMFNPVTGALTQKPRLSDKISVPDTQGPDIQNPLFSQAVASMLPQMSAPSRAAAPMPSGNMGGPVNEFQMRFEDQMAKSAGNPKLQQEIQAAYSKSLLAPDATEASAGGYADRISTSNPLIEQYGNAGLSQYNRSVGEIPLIGNLLVSKDYKNLKQAERDFLSAKLRKESGAVIGKDEYAGGSEQYFPQPGDTPEVLAQKEANRVNAERGLIREAGPSYTPNQKLQADFDNKKSNKGGIFQIKDDSEYDSLASGTVFIDPEGKKRVKP